MTNQVCMVLFIFLTGVYAGYYVTDSKWQSKWDTAETIAAENQMNAVNETVVKFNKQIEKLESANVETKAKLINATVINNTLDTANQRLQEQYSISMSEPYTCDQSPTTKRGVNTETIKRDLHTNMFRVLSNRAAEYAKIADENRIRGLSCQADYEILIRQAH